MILFNFQHIFGEFKLKSLAQKYIMLNAIQTIQYTVNEQNLTIVRTRRMPLEQMLGDPGLWAA